MLQRSSEEALPLPRLLSCLPVIPRQGFLPSSELRNSVLVDETLGLRFVALCADQGC